MKNILQVATLCLFSFNALGGLVSHSMGSFLTVRHCPTALNESECINEAQNGPGYTERDIQLNYATNQLSYSNSYSNGTLSLDPVDLSVPEFKFAITSDPQQRNGVNLFAYQEYTWTGSDATVEFEVNFDFVMSNGTWDTGVDSLYRVNIMFVDDIEPGGYFFPTLGTTLSEQSFISTDHSVVAHTRFFGSLTAAQAVTTNQSFYLYTQVQAFGINGGYVDSLNTLTANINAFDSGGSPIDQTTLQASLQVQNRGLFVSEPSTLVFILLAVAGLAFRNRRNNL